MSYHRQLHIILSADLVMCHYFIMCDRRVAMCVNVNKSLSWCQEADNTQLRVGGLVVYPCVLVKRRPGGGIE